MKAQQSGFTLIELVMVIVILGILAATAVPKFIDLSSEARDAAVKGTAGAISSASAINYAAKVANKAYGITGGQTCAAAITAITVTADVSNYTISGGPISSTEGNTTTCTLTDSTDSSYTAGAAIIAVN